MNYAKNNGFGSFPSVECDLKYLREGDLENKYIYKSQTETGLKTSQVKYLITNRHMLWRFAKNNRTVARKAMCLIVIFVSFSCDCPVVLFKTQNLLIPYRPLNLNTYTYL